MNPKHTKKYQASSRYALFVMNPKPFGFMNEALSKYDFHDFKRTGVEFEIAAMPEFVELLKGSEIHYFDSFDVLLDYQSEKKKKRIAVDDCEYPSIKEHTLRRISFDTVHSLGLDEELEDDLRKVDCYVFFRFYDETKPLLKGDAFRMARRANQFQKLNLVDYGLSNGLVKRDVITDRKLIVDDSARSLLRADIRDALNPSDFEGTIFDVKCCRPTLLLNSDINKIDRRSTGYVLFRGHHIPWKEFKHCSPVASVDEIINTKYYADGTEHPLFRLCPCGVCFPCSEHKKSIFKTDLSHEMLYQSKRFRKPCTLFLTLTYADEFLDDNEINSEHFTKFAHDLHLYFAPKRRNKLVTIETELNKFQNDAHYRKLIKSGYSARSARLSADKLYPCRSVSISKETGRMAACFHSNTTNLTSGEVWNPDEFLTKDFNICGVSEYGKKRDRRHFHAIVVGLPEQLFYTPGYDEIFNVNFADKIAKGSIKPHDELLGLFQYFWPYGYVEARVCYGDNKNISSYLSKYVNKQVGSFRHNVVPQIYKPRRPFGKYFVAMDIDNLCLRQGLKVFNLQRKRKYYINLRGKWMKYDSPTAHIVDSFERPMSFLMRSALRKYVASAYSYCTGVCAGAVRVHSLTHESECADIVELVDSFLEGRSVYVKKLFTTLTDEFDSDNTYLPKAVHYMNRKYALQLHLDCPNSKSYHLTKRYMRVVSERPYLPSLQKSEVPYTFNNVCDVIIRLEEVLNTPSPNVPSLTIEQYYDKYFAMRSQFERNIPMKSSRFIESLVDFNNLHVSDQIARGVDDDQ